MGSAVRRALEHSGPPSAARADDGAHVHDPVFRVLRSRAGFLTARQIAGLAVPSRGGELSQAAVLGRLRHLGQDFELEVADSGSGDGPAYRLGRFKAFLGQPEHARHQVFAARRATIS